MPTGGGVVLLLPYGTVLVPYATIRQSAGGMSWTLLPPAASVCIGVFVCSILSNAAALAEAYAPVPEDEPSPAVISLSNAQVGGWRRRPVPITLGTHGCAAVTRACRHVEGIQHLWSGGSAGERGPAIGAACQDVAPSTARACAYPRTPVCAISLLPWLAVHNMRLISSPAPATPVTRPCGRAVDLPHVRPGGCGPAGTAARLVHVRAVREQDGEHVGLFGRTCVLGKH